LPQLLAIEEKGVKLMSNMSSPALAAKAKAMYGQRLKKEDYEELLRKGSVAEIAGYLKNETAYSSTLRDIYENRIHRGQLEGLIRQNMYEKIEKLLQFSMLTKNRFYRMNIVKREIEIILLALRSIMPDKLEEDESYATMIQDIPISLSDYFSFDVNEISEIMTFEDILDILSQTPYLQIIKPYQVEKGTKIDFTSIERDLNNYFYKYAFQVIDESFSGKRRSELTDIYRTQIELLNIIKIYRFKKFFKVTNDQIRKSVVTLKSRMSDAFINELIEEPTAEGVLKRLEESKYNLYVDDSEYTYIEYFANNIKYNLAKRYMHFSIESPIVFTAYSILLEIEVTNIINIVEGIRYDTPQSEIEKLLIY